jgi:hypothetical protein
MSRWRAGLQITVSPSLQLRSLSAVSVAQHLPAAGRERGRCVSAQPGSSRRAWLCRCTAFGPAFTWCAEARGRPRGCGRPRPDQSGPGRASVVLLVAVDRYVRSPK